MAVKIRLARTGAKKAPYYRIVVADSRAKRDGRFIEILGRYNPRVQPSIVEFDTVKAREWVAKGAQMTETVEKLLAIAEGTKEVPEVEAKPSKKSVAKAEAEAKAAEAPQAGAETEAATEEVATEEVAVEEVAAEGASAEETPSEEASADVVAEEESAPEAEASAEESAAEAAPEEETSESPEDQ